MFDEPMRVLLRGDHPWSGHVGEVIDLADETNADTLKVQLDNGYRVIAFSGQWQRLTHVG